MGMLGFRNLIDACTGQEESKRDKSHVAGATNRTAHPVEQRTGRLAPHAITRAVEIRADGPLRQRPRRPQSHLALARW